MSSNQKVIFVSVLSLLACAMPSTHAATFDSNPTADAFVTSAQPASNFGGAGGLALAAPGLSQGEFQSVLRFDTASARASFDATYGVGKWTIQSIALRLSAQSPNNPIFNAAAAGQFNASWIQNDTWVEGTGTPAAPGVTGITFATLPTFISGADEALGTFAYNGATSGANTYALALTAGLLADTSAGSLVSLRTYAADIAVSYLFRSRSFGTVSDRPVLSITAIPEPATLMLLGASLAFCLRNPRLARIS